MRISDWSSDVCSSDLGRPAARGGALRRGGGGLRRRRRAAGAARRHRTAPLVAAVLPRHRAGALRELGRSEEHTSELQSLMRISYAVFCLKKKNQHRQALTKHATHEKPVPKLSK